MWTSPGPESVSCDHAASPAPVGSGPAQELRSTRVKTRGLTHLALAVRDAQRSSRFYQQVFGMVETYRGDGWAQVETPGCHDVLVLTEEEPDPGKAGGIRHFGFRLVDAADIGAAVEAVEAAGGTVRSRGEFVPGEPYLFFSDPDGYEVEIWFEPAR